MLRVDLACGSIKGPRLPATDGPASDSEGWTGVDIAPCEGVDIVHDLTVYPWPFADESVDEVYCSHYVEHIPHDIGTGLDGFLAFGNELHRILKPGSQATIIAPYYTSMRAWQDPTHLRAITERTFLYWDRVWLESQGLGHYGVTADFDFTYGYQFTDPYWITAHEEKRVFALAHYFNVADDLVVTLTKRA